MKLDFVDYHGPTGAFIALGHTEKVAEYQRLVEARKAKTKRSAVRC